MASTRTSTYGLKRRAKQLFCLCFPLIHTSAVLQLTFVSWYYLQTQGGGPPLLFRTKIMTLSRGGGTRPMFRYGGAAEGLKS